jgi:hypothetical protein
MWRRRGKDSTKLPRQRRRAPKHAGELAFVNRRNSSSFMTQADREVAVTMNFQLGWQEVGGRSWGDRGCVFSVEPEVMVFGDKAR